MMKTKLWMMSMAVMLGCLLASCSDSDDNNGGENNGVANTDYANKTYGNLAISSCTALTNELTKANTAIGSAQLTAEQESYLREVLRNIVNNVIVPTYTQLGNEVEQLEAALRGLNTSTITQENVNTACDHFKRARQYWELSEAFLMGAASDFDIDPTIDSWPLNRTLLLSYFKNGMSEEALEDATILGFHALEFILFRNGSPRQVSELRGNDTYKNFTSISGAQELAYAQTICTLLKQRTFQLQVAWEGETTANKNRVDVVKAAQLDITTQNGLSYGNNLINAGISGSKSTFPTLKTAIAQVLSDDEGSCLAIANEVGTAKISNPFSAGDISYVESPYSYNSITDFCDNIRSIRNVWLGTTDGTVATYSMHQFFANVGMNSTNTAVETAYNQAIINIGNMPAPFVKYVSTIWNLAFEDDETWE
ncbi:MAG: imelysin family protein [Prevotella sp.]